MNIFCFLGDTQDDQNLCFFSTVTTYIIFVLFQYDDGIHSGYIDSAAGSMYEPHVAHRPSLPIHHSPHLNAMHPYHSNHVNPTANHVMGGGVADVGKRDKDAIYG